MTTAPDPFAPPQVRPLRFPAQTTGDLFHMRSRFRVGGQQVEVETGHWNGTEVYRVNGEERLRKRNMGWHSREAIEVGGRTMTVSGRWYPLLPVTVDVDGRRVIDDLFPQLRRLTRTIGLLSSLAMGAFTVSILWDLYRLFLV